MSSQVHRPLAFANGGNESWDTLDEGRETVVLMKGEKENKNEKKINRMIRAPRGSFASAIRFTTSCSTSSLQVILMRCGFLGFLVTARHRHEGLSSPERTPLSTIDRIVPAEGLSSSPSSVLDTSTVQ